jgi:hypothetical protein
VIREEIDENILLWSAEIEEKFKKFSTLFRLDENNIDQDSDKDISNFCNF